MAAGKELEPLTADDFDDAPKTTEVTLRGKRAYVRVISFDDQVEIQKFKGTEAQQSIAVLAMCLCDKAGNKMFKNYRQGIKKLGNLEVTEVFAAIMSAAQKNALGDAAVKKSRTARQKRSKSGSR